jgi:uncharacterized membrane-anchored protein YitT (DUF2179 family)
MGTYIIVSVGSGLLLAILDGLLNANPLARRLYREYEPITRKSIPMVRGILIDIAFGFLLAGLYLMLYRGIPVPPGIARAIAFGFIVWVLRSLMNTLSHWTMYDIQVSAHLYALFAGLLKSLSVSLVYWLILSPVG